MALPDREAMPPNAEPGLRFTIDARICELAPASERLRHYLDQHRVDAATIFALEMVIEEIATNAMKYGYRPSRDGRITIEATATERSTELVIEDDADAFDPTIAPEPDVNRSLESMPVGGLGIHLVRSVRDAFDYERVNGCNRVRVRIDRKS